MGLIGQNTVMKSTINKPFLRVGIDQQKFYWSCCECKAPQLL